MIDTTQLAFPKPNCAKARNRKRRSREGDARRFQEEVLALDNRCMDLGCECHKQSNPVLGGHHINPKGRGVVDNSVENGITLCQFGAHIRVTKGHQKNGVRVSAAQAMIDILEQHLGKPHWRWDDAYALLRTQV